MIEYLQTITVWQTVLWIVGTIAVVAVLIRNWQSIRPTFNRFRSCFRRSKANQALLFEHEEKLEEVQQDVKIIKRNLTELTADSREYRKTSLSDKIFKKYQEYKKDGYVTKDQIENFNICVERYKKCVSEDDIDNDLVITKYFNEVMQLNIKGE